MAIKISNEAERNLLNIYVTLWASTPATVRLYKADITPADDDELADYSANEANYSGYAAQNLAGGAVAGAPDGGGRATASWTLQSYAHNGGGTSNSVYGYYVTNNGNDELLWAERFPNAVTFAVAGDGVQITPRFTLKSEN